MITKDKHFILLEGEGAQQPVIEWDDHVTFDWAPLDGPNLTSTLLSTVQSAAFTTVLAPNFVAKWICFKNTYKEIGQSKQAVAVVVGGDKSSFRQCRFIGYQDTLYDYHGRHYFDRCYIEGVVDFIFGFGRSIYEGCTLNSIADSNTTGWLTANGRDSSNDISGFVFKNCIVTGRGKTFLGRAWRPHSRVVFCKTVMSNSFIVPEGWDAWSAKGHEDLTTFAEYGCSGPGFKPTSPPRVNWKKNQSDSEALEYASIKFIDPEGWLVQQP